MPKAGHTREAPENEAHPRRSVNEEVELVVLDELDFALDAADTVLPPTHLALTAHRLGGFGVDGRARDQNWLREPFQNLAEVLHVPGRLTATVRIGVRGTREAPDVVSDILVGGLGGAEIEREVAAVRDQLDWHLGGPWAPFRLSALPLRDLHWPSDGDAAFIRQQLMQIGEGNAQFELPLRFTFPGRDAPYRLLTALLASGPGTDLFVSITPTTLHLDERERMERAGRAAGTVAIDGGFGRDVATLADVTLSYRTDLYVLQVLVVGRERLAEVTLRAVGSALTAGYDAERHPGHRIVSRPDRFVGGGFEVEPCRNAGAVLARLHYGLPAIGTGPTRELVDLATSTEVAYCFAWLADPEGRLPGLSTAGTRAPVVELRAGTVELGDDAGGDPVRIADQDRRLHSFFVGVSGSYKTTELVHLAAQDAAAGRPVVTVSPHADLAERFLDRLPSARRRETFYLDASTGGFDRLNYLAVYPPGSAEQRRICLALNDGLTADINKDFAGPVYLRVMGGGLWAASLSGGCLNDVVGLLHEPARLARIAVEAGDVNLAALAEECCSWTESQRAEMNTYVTAKLAWLDDPGLRDTFDAPATFSLPEAIDAGSIIVVTAGDAVGAVAVAMSTFLEVLLCCVARRTGTASTLSLYLDEIQRYCGRVLRQLTNESRKRGIAVHAATQNLTNLDDQVEALLSNAGTLVIGRSTATTAAFAESELGLARGSLGRLANFRAIARTTVDGQPSDPFELRITPPQVPFPQGPPAWLSKGARRRRREAE